MTRVMRPMRLPRFLLCLAVILLLAGLRDAELASCPGTATRRRSRRRSDPSSIPVEQLYNNGVDALNAASATPPRRSSSTLSSRYYPYSSWAVNAQLMQGYAEYLQNHYTEAIGALDRFIQLHPAHRDIAYAYYLRALCYYEQIADIQRDQKGTQEAMARCRKW